MKETAVAFKRSASLATALDMFGIDVTLLVEGEHSGDQLAIAEYVSRPGLEPPPHCHEYDDEIFYILEGSFEAYCGHQVIEVRQGECLFLPCGKPHAWIIQTPKLRTLIVARPAGMGKPFRSLRVLKNGVPKSAATRDDDTISDDRILKLSTENSIRILTHEEIAIKMPQFPLRSQPWPPKRRASLIDS